jgi:hypothetical protein
MREELLHCIWQYQLFDKINLTTEDGSVLEILQQGNLNTDAGPDFTNAKIRIGKIVLAGNIEVHVKNTDWEIHKHQLDSSYNNTILHVVFETSKPTTILQNGNEIPILPLKNRVEKSLLLRYEVLQNIKKDIPCAPIIKEIKQDFKIENFLERLTIERLENKVSQLNEILQESNFDWEQVAFQMIAKYFGTSVNKEPFFMLASSLPIAIIYKHQQDSKQIEALLFGQAGFLDTDFNDEYPKALKREYNYLKKLHQLTPSNKSLWKFLRLRPSNFPTIRLSQLASLLSRNEKLFSSILAAESITHLRKLFEVHANSYFETHYIFDKQVKTKSSKTGNMNIDIVLINAIIPILFAFGKYKDNEEYCERAAQFLSQIIGEKNAIIKQMTTHGFKNDTAYHTQGILELRTNYCDKKRCLSCAIGHKILSI